MQGETLLFDNTIALLEPSAAVAGRPEGTADARLPLTSRKSMGPVRKDYRSGARTRY
jgi:hypothetical protein